MKISDKARKIISTIAPTLGKALGGPLGALAGNVIADALGGDDIEATLAKQDPAALAALRAAEQLFVAKMRELDIREEELDGIDRSSARDLAKLDMHPQVILSAVFVVGYFGLLLAWMGGALTLPETGHDLFVGLIAVLGAGVTQVLNFWFGSSHGSAQKNAYMKGAKP